MRSHTTGRASREGSRAITRLRRLREQRLRPVGRQGRRGDHAPATRSRHRPNAEFRHTKVSALTRADRLRFWGIALLWIAVNVSFWAWWLTRASHGSPWLYWAETLALFYQTTFLPTVFWRFVAKMKRPVEVRARSHMHVALITPCVPAHESLDVIRDQLEALQNVEYPHDSWILDEGGSPEVRALAEEHGVNYFTRRGVDRWNQPRPPVPGRYHSRQCQRVACTRRGPRDRLRSIRPTRHRSQTTS
jgi:hypothetical protein